MNLNITWHYISSLRTFSGSVNVYSHTFKWVDGKRYVIQSLRYIWFKKKKRLDQYTFHSLYISPYESIFQDANRQSEIKQKPLKEVNEPRLFFCYSVNSSKVIFLCSRSLTSRNNLGEMNRSSSCLGRKVEILKSRLLTLIETKPNEIGLAAEEEREREEQMYYTFIPHQ